MHPVINPIEANDASELSFTFPHKPIIQHKIPINPAVLKFGCFSIRNIRKQKVNIEVNFLVFLTKSQCAKRFDASKIKKGLINSEGCKLIIPSPNHLEEPLTVIPLILVSNIKKIKK